MKKKNVVFLCVLTAVTFSLLSFFLTGFFMRSSDNGRIYIDNNEYSELMRYFELKEIADIVEEQYCGDADRDTLIGGALSGSVDVLDDGYSRFYPAEDFAWFDGAEESSGIAQGLMLEKDAKTGYIRVTRVFADTSGYEANILKGDIITSIDGRDTREIDVENAVARLKGQSGTEAKLTIISGDSDEEVEMTVKRRIDDVGLVYGDMLTSQIGYISVAEFGKGCAGELESVLKTLEDNNAKKLIIDLRGVSGGFISSAAECADLFLSEGMIVEQYDKQGVKAKWGADSSVKWSKSVVILTDGKTSGCAEVFAAALKDNGAAQTVGTTTAGRAITKKYFELTDSGDGIRLITGGYTSPDGTDLAKTGVAPDVEAKQGDDDGEKSDAVISAATELLG